MCATPFDSKQFKQATLKGFAAFRPKRWTSALPEFSGAAAFLAGSAKAVAALPGWGPARLTRLFNTALDQAQATPTPKGLPAHNEEMLAMENRRPFKRLPAKRYSPTQQTNVESHQFRLLLARQSEPTVPVGVLNFSCAVYWPTAHGLSPAVVADWGVSSIDVRLCLGDVWVLPGHRSQGWSETLVEAYSVALLGELDAIARQLTAVRPVKGDAHRLNVAFEADYRSKAGRRAGGRILRELKARVRGWRKAHPVFQMSLNGEPL